MSTPARTEQSAAPVEPAADHALLHGMDPQDLGTEVAGAVIGAQLATVDVDARGQTLLHLQAIDEGVMDALGGAKEAGVGVTLDPSAWPIVHGSPESQDRTGWRQPRGDPKRRFMLFSSQSVHEDEEANALYMGHLLMQNVKDGASDDAGKKEVKEEEGPGYYNEASALMDFKVSDANAVSIITERVSERESRLWTSTIGNVVVYRQVNGASGLQRLASFDHGRNTRFHGSYAFVASNGTENGFFTTMEDKVARFVLRGSDKDGWRILQTGELALPSSSSSTGAADHLVGLTALDDGTIVAGSKHGVIMAVRMDAQGGFILQSTLPIANHTSSKLPALVSNSLSSAGQAIFVVTHRELVRVDLDPHTRKLSLAWATPYHDRDMPWYVGRLGVGSGSTPSVTECGGHQLVVITDGALPMQVQWYDAATGALVGQKTVQFTPEEEGTLPTTSEQSVAVSGCKAFVVQNYLGDEELDPSITCASAPRQSSVLRRRLGNYCHMRLDPKAPEDLFPVKACPVVLGCSAFGAALYEISPPELDGKTHEFEEIPPGAPPQEEEGEEMTWAVRRSWVRDDVSCGTSIPLISTHPESQIVYCVGLKEGSNQWGLLGMDLETGQDRAHLQFYERNLALNALANPFYAGVEATGEDMVTVGAIGGVLHLSPESPTLVGNSGMLDDDSSAAAAAATTAAGGGEKKGVSSSKKGIFFLSEGSASDRAATLHQAGLRVIEDRTASASSTVWGHKVMDVLGQEALAVLVLLLGGGVVLLLMRWRRRGPWSPRIPR